MSSCYLAIQLGVGFQGKTPNTSFYTQTYSYGSCSPDSLWQQGVVKEESKEALLCLALTHQQGSVLFFFSQRKLGEAEIFKVWSSPLKVFIF